MQSNFPQKVGLQSSLVISHLAQLSPADIADGSAVGRRCFKVDGYKLNILHEATVS